MKMLPTEFLNELNGFISPNAINLRTTYYASANDKDTFNGPGDAKSFAKDAAFFEMHPHRCQLLREVSPRELIQFQTSETPSWMLQLIASIESHVPPLWVHVSWIAEGGHEIKPVYRGKSFFPTHRELDREIATALSDERIFAILREMQKREGQDNDAIQNFLLRFFEAHGTEALKNVPTKSVN